jgi:hypothetical protein
MNWLSLRNNQLKIETLGELPIVLEESIGYVQWIQRNRKILTCNRLDLESLGSWPTIYMSRDFPGVDWGAPSYGLRNCSGNPKQNCLRMKLCWELGESLGNLHNHTQMLLYIQLKYISFQGWSSKWAWSWWLVPLILPGSDVRWMSCLTRPLYILRMWMNCVLKHTT